MRIRAAVEGKKGTILLLLLLLAMNAVFIFMHVNHYEFYIQPLARWNIPLLLNMSALTVAMLVSRKWRRFSIIISILGMFLVAFRMWGLIMGWNYATIESPKGTETLVIKYRDAILGERTYFYQFYQSSRLSITMEYLTVLDLMVPNDEFDIYPNAKRTLGSDHPIWLSETEVKFHTKDGPFTLIIDNGYSKGRKF
ncbi:hypothetical protein AB4Z21_28145 [Paenibacillus sp. MCAF20]